MTAALSVEGIRAGYGRIEVLHGVSLDVPRGSVVALLGPNGAGKTTTLRAISGLIPLRAGAVRLEGRRIDGRRPSTIARRGVVMVPEGRGVFPGLSVAENLRIAHRSVPAAVAGPWASWLDEVAMSFPVLRDRLDQQAGSLSGGEQQMLALSRALVGSPQVLLFDELSMGLAPIVVGQLFDQVAALRHAGRTIVLVEQYLTHALRLADICYVLAKGRVAWCGEPGELRDSAAAADYLAG